MADGTLMAAPSESHIGPTELIERVRAQGRAVLVEDEALLLAAGLGLRTPRHRSVVDAAEARSLELASFPGSHVVVKVLSPRVLHRSDVGAVRVVPRWADEVAAAVADLERTFGGDDVRYLVEERVVREARPGDELLLGMRVTREFGPVVTVAPGGLLAETLAPALRPDQGPVVWAPDLDLEGALRRELSRRHFLAPAVEGVRGQPPLLGLDALEALVRRFGHLARELMAAGVGELEFNPVLLTAEGPWAVDGLGRLGEPGILAEARPPRPGAAIGALLRPHSIAVMGVSERMNPGRVILRNILDAGFDARVVTVVKSGPREIDGCRCVATLSDLPEPVDLLVVSLAAEQVPPVLEEVTARDLAAAVILVAGGMDVDAPGGSPARQVRQILDRARASGGGPVVNGPNCLGIRSVPGGYDTLFIPRHKLRVSDGSPAPVAVLSQSGAFAIARMSRLRNLNPRYVVTLGNQLDLTLADYLDHLLEDPEVAVAACYVEGFVPGDGRAFLESARRWSEAGRRVLLYRAGRSEAGARAAASHTASVAGDYAVTRELSGLAGVEVAQDIEEFQARMAVLAAWAGRGPGGHRLGVVSNAGFECVAMADTLGGRELADLAPATRSALADLLAEARLEEIVGVANPLDVTPIMSDAGFVEAARLVLADPGVDVGLVGCVPLTPALQTLAASGEHAEDHVAADSVVSGLVRLWNETSKPWAVVVDSGPDYEPMRQALERAGIPVLRSANAAHLG